MPATSSQIDSSLQRVELARSPTDGARALLASPEAAVRIRAALAVGRIGDGEAVAPLTRLLADPEAAEMAAWALGRIDGGRDALIRCLAARCLAAPAAARALSGPAAFKLPAVDALTAALSGPSAAEAALSLGVLSRNKEATFPEATYAALAAALRREDARAAAAYALSRLPRGDGVPAGLDAALRDRDPWTRSMAARAWGRQGLAGQALRDAFRDSDWRVRVEAARGLPGAAAPAVALREAFAGQTSPHVVVALSEAAAQLGEPPPEPATFADPISRCAAAQARDRLRKQLIDTPDCAPSGWRSRARSGAVAAELGLAQAREAFRDADGRVRGAAAGAAGAPFTEDLRKLLGDEDPYVVQEAAGALAKLPRDDETKQAALAAVQRLAAHMPKLELSEAQISVLAAFLASLD